jgi:carboxyl-terminal processing protease
MENNHHKHTFQRLVTGIIIILFFVGGIFIGRQHATGNQLDQIDEFLTTSENKDFTQFWSVWKLLNDKYPFKEKIPSDALRVQGAIAGMVASFKDPYTMFFPPEQAKLFAEEVKGEFGGVGMEVGVKDGLITIIAPLKGSPAEKAGIKSGDILVKIDTESTENMSADHAVSLIRGTVGTSVELTLARKDAPEFIKTTITREIINIPIIDTKKEGEVFIINFYSFSETSPKLFNSALDEFVASGSKKLIIDLRNNPGGYLDAAVDIASYFVPQGKIIVRENTGDVAPEKLYRSAGSDIILPSNLQMILLVNNGSASASEILAGALSEHGVAKLVGTKTFGKGSVQELVPLPDGSSVKITVAKWFTPNNVSISEKGISPDHIVTDESSEKNPDPVLEKALQLFNK